MPILLPTRERVENLKRLIKACRETETTESVCLLLDDDDLSPYEELDMPNNWWCIISERTGICQKMNEFFEKNPNEEYYGLLADDVVPETPHWDQKLKAACLPDRLAWGSDGIQNERLPTHPFIGGELVRKLGWIGYPLCKHWFVDNVWAHIAYDAGRGVYLPEVKTSHHHFINNKAKMDRTYMDQPSQSLDAQNYRHFTNFGLIPLLEKLHEEKETEKTNILE